MKKTLFIMLAMVLALSLAACGGNGGTDSLDGNNNAKNDNSQKSNLNLPLEVENITVIDTDNLYGNEFLYIANDGNLYYETSNLSRREVLLDNVRSIYYSGYPEVFYAIKKDNSLWAKGTNNNGEVGDGTGVSRDEFVKIADDVANMVVGSASVLSPMVYAIKTDKTLWHWGNKIMEPTKVEDNIVKCLGYSNGSTYFLRSDGSVIDLKYGDMKISNVVDAYRVSNMVDGSWTSNGGVWYVLFADGTFCKTTVKNDDTITSQEICKDVERMVAQGEFKNGSYGQPDYNGISIHLLKKDGSLWGLGNNSLGQLGDGTKVDRDEPVKISDSVKSISIYGCRSDLMGSSSRPYYVTSDGTSWVWTNNDPVPKQLTSSPMPIVFALWNGEYPIGVMQDGKIMFGSSLKNAEFDFKSPYGEHSSLEQQTVMLPSTLTFE